MTLEFSPRHRFAAVWVCAAALAALLYRQYGSARGDFAGIVESRIHNLSAQEPGRLSAIFAAVGDEVHAGQVLATLDTSDLTAERALLAEKSARLENIMSADRRRYALEYQKLRLQTDASAADITLGRAEVEAKRGELQAIETEVVRLRAAEQTGLGRSSELSALLVKREAAAQFVREGDPTFSTAGPARRPRIGSDSGDGEADSVMLSMLNSRFETREDVKLKMARLEQRIEYRSVFSPCNCRVAGLDYFVGDTVDAFAVIVRLEELQAEYVDGYVPETSSALPALGQSVVAHSRVLSRSARGVVTFISPGFSALPARLSLSRTETWARRFRVKLDSGHGLFPGEVAEIELVGGGPFVRDAHAQAREPVGQPLQEPVQQPVRESAPKAAGASTVAAPQQAVLRDRSTLSEMQVPQALRRMTSFEPSGLAWLAGIERYVIASDDTGRSADEHAPWLFYMDAQGQVETRPVVVAGVKQVNDLEAIAPAPDGSLYLVSSQNVSRRGKRPVSRHQLLRVERSGRDLTVIGAAGLLSALASSYSAAELRGLGLQQTDEDGQIVLNIEGAAWLGNDLLLGLKAPRPDGGAIIWRLADPARFLSEQRLAPKQLTVFGRVDLRTPDGRPAAISDLVVDERGDLYALSTVPGPGAHPQIGGMHRLITGKDGALHAVPLFAFPGLKSEGICSLGHGRFTIVFDTDDQPPAPFVTVEVPAP